MWSTSEARLLEARIAGFEAFVMRLSPRGVQLRITDEGFATGGDLRHPTAYAARVRKRLPGPFSVVFGAGVSARAEVVRVSGYCGKDGRLILVECRFVEPLGAPARAVLGLG